MTTLSSVSTNGLGKILFLFLMVIFATILVLHDFTQDSLQQSQTLTDIPVSFAAQRSSSRKSTGFVYRSSMSCIGNMKNLEASWERSCVMRNVCLRKSTKTLEYYSKASTRSDLLDNSVLHAILFDEVDGPISHNLKTFLRLPQKFEMDTFAQSEIPLENETVHFLSGTHLYRRGQEHPNLGHLLWDVLFNFYLTSENLFIPLEPARTTLVISTDQRKSNVNKILRKLKGALSVLSTRPLKSFENLLNKPADLLCFEQFGVFQGQSPSTYTFQEVTKTRDKTFNWIKGKHLYNFRNLILAKYEIDPFHVPSSHSIVLMNKTTSGIDESPRRTILNLDQVYELLQFKYSHIPIQIMDPLKLSFGEQLQILSKTTLLISPSGGISTIFPFLPKDSHGIFFDYPSTRDHMNYLKGSSVSIDAVVWDSLAWVHPLYYQVFNETEWKWDSNEKRKHHDSRGGVSVIADLERLSVLIDKALSNMNF